VSSSKEKSEDELGKRQLLEEKGRVRFRDEKKIGSAMDAEKEESTIDFNFSWRRRGGKGEKKLNIGWCVIQEAA